MVTDVFDSIKFNPGRGHNSSVPAHYWHASAALYESLIFHEEPLALTCPQLIDGFFAVLPDANLPAAGHRSLLFSLLESGHIRIAMYSERGTRGIRSLKEYLERFVFSRSFIYSSMPELTYWINTEKDSLVTDCFDRIKTYLLGLFEERTLDKPACDNSPIGREMEYFMDFMSHLICTERQLDTRLYHYCETTRPSFGDYLAASLPDNSDTMILLSLMATRHRSEVLEKLRACTSRSMCDTLLADGTLDLDPQTAAHIRSVIGILYNKHAMSAFDRAEFHTDARLNEGQRAILERTLGSGCGENTLPAFRYTDTEKITRIASGICDTMTLEKALEIRAAVRRIQSEQPGLGWGEALGQFHRVQSLRGLGISFDDAGGHRMELGDGIRFTAAPDYHSAALADLLDDFLELRQDSYIKA